MSRKNRLKVPRKYRKPLSEKKFNALSGKLPDRSEFKLLQKYFPAGTDGKYRFTVPEETKEAEKAADLIKKIHKQRSGPRTIRLVFLLAVVGGPILFNLLFLDRLAADFLEKNLENLTGTDVSVEGLDIAPTSGSISLETLSFASTSDPMKNEVELVNILTDVNWSSLFYRRIVIDAVEAGVFFGTERESPAVYPAAKLKTGPSARSGSGTADILSPVLDLIGETLMPSESIARVQALNSEVQTAAGEWTDRISEDIQAAGRLSDDVEEFLRGPLPKESDITGWMTKIEEGRRLAAELDRIRNSLEAYRRDLINASAEAAAAVREARLAVEEDLKKIESAVNFDSEMISRWIEGVVRAYAGPKFAANYSRIASLAGRIQRDSSENGKVRAADETGSGRMKRGRVVPFPVTLPPRFTIRRLLFTGKGIRIKGTDIGIDHHLAGRPSDIEIDITNLEGLSGSLNSRLTVDGRGGAENLLVGRVDARDIRWFLAQEDIRGNLTAQADFSVSELPEGRIVSGGTVSFSNWSGRIETGGLTIINEASPPLSFNYGFKSIDGNTELNIRPDRDSISSWGAVIADSAVSETRDRARRYLLENVDADLGALESAAASWDDEQSTLDNLVSQLEAQDLMLNRQISEWTKQSSGNLPVPEASDLLDGLGSLF